MRKLAGVVGVVCVMTVALAQPPAPAPVPAPAPAPAPVPAEPAPTPSAVQPGIPVAPAVAQPAKKYEIPADAKPLLRQELPGGLIVEDFVIGTGTAVAADSAVVANYHGTLKDGGAAFDSSWDPAFQHPEPAVFSLNRVIPGWTQGLPGMKAGGIRRLTIPAALAYGPQEKRDQNGNVTIPANSDLVFVVELIDTPGSEDITVGTGEEVGKSAVCVTAHTVKTADGTEVESSTAAKPYIWIPGENAAIDAAMKGMKVGGKRRITVPAQLNQNAPLPDIKRPASVSLVVEVELIAVRNLPSR
ncbi:MAG: FKBP-type peptidyl-prolyl cis-trans isomerase [Phycisphaerales bacterium]|nr:FKBP-type peptidyl-prolyl cis-trans isomerase [Phycisphaerales bacterium]